MNVRALLLLCAALLPGCAKKLDASFEGSITMRTTLAGSAPTDMTLDVKSGKMRFDLGQGPEATHGIYDATKNEVLVIMDQSKTFTTLDFSRASAPAPNTTAEASIAEKAGGKDTIAGIACEKWIAKEPSGRHSEVCVVEGVNFLDLNRLRSGAAGASGMGAQSMQDKKMFPLRSVEFDATGKETSRMEVTQIEKKSIDDARFVVPAGYTKLDPAGSKLP